MPSKGFIKPLELNMIPISRCDISPLQGDNLATCLKQSINLEAWITGQLTEMQSTASKRHQQDQSVLDGWTMYYTYIQKRLSSGEALGVEKDLWIEEMHPDQSERWPRALLSWIEQEMPHLVNLHDGCTLVGPRSLRPPSPNTRPKSQGKSVKKTERLSQVIVSKVFKTIKRTRASQFQRRNANAGSSTHLRRSARIAGRSGIPHRMPLSSNIAMKQSPPPQLRRSARIATLCR